MKKGKEEKLYAVSFDMKYSHEVIVKAKGKTEAKKKAFAKFARIRNKRSEYNIEIEEEPIRGCF